MTDANITWAYPASDSKPNGTVNYGDIIELQWIADATFQIWPMLYCADADTVLVNTTATSSPFAFLFTSKVSSGDVIGCHFDFQNSSANWVDGMSVGLAYNGTKASKATTWSLSVSNSDSSDTSSSSSSANAGVAIESSTSSSALSSATGASSETGSAKKGLSTGAEAGIGVGVALGALLLLLAVGAYIWRRRRRQAVVKNISSEYKPVEDDAVEMDGAGERKELATIEKPQELEHDREPAELDNNSKQGGPGPYNEPVELP